MSGVCRTWLVRLGFILLLAGLSPAAMAEQGGATAGADSERSEAPLPGTVEEITGRQAALERRIKDVKERAADTLGAMSSGATYDEIKERAELFRRWLGALDAELRSLRRLRSALEFAREKGAEAQTWSGFPGQPPYPFSLAEQIRDEVSAQQLEVQSLQLMRSMYEESLARNSATLVLRQKELRLAREKAESREGGVRGKWLVELAELRVRSAECSVESTEFARVVTVESLRGRRAYLNFLEHKLKLAQADMRFTQEELTAALDRISRKQVEIQEELTAALAGDGPVRQALESARAELSRLENAPPAEAPSRAALGEKRAAVELAAARVETNELKIEQLRTMIFQANALKTLWETRFWLTGERSLAELREKEQEYRRRMESQAQWRRLLEGKMNALVLQSNRDAFPQGRGEWSAAEGAVREQIKADLEVRLSLYQNSLRALAYAEELTQRLCDELAGRQSGMSATGRLWHVIGSIGTFLLDVWNAELYVAEDSVIADGRRIPVSRSVTVGKVAIALLLFSIGIFLSRRIYRATKNRGARWFREDMQIQIVAVALALVTAIFSLCVAMASVRIPWSIFAFAGGALAIGIGFGAQTMVKNFITGILLIFGGTIRAGDIIEMDGQVGQVISIGFSKTLLRRPDGIELLVPNCRFTEQSLTNWTHSDNLVRQTVSVGVAYGSPTQLVSELIARAAQEHPKVLKDPRPVVLFEEFGDSALQFSVRFWLALSKDLDAPIVRSELRHRINALFAEAGIVLPFPQRDVHMDVQRPVEVRILNAGASDPEARSDSDR